MAKIRDAKPKASSGGYDRVFNDAELGYLCQRVQSTVISNGSELEKLIERQSRENGTLLTVPLDTFMQSVHRGEIKMAVYVCTKKMVKDSSYRVDKHEPDFLIFELSDNLQKCYVVELKDGGTIDTKKADGEYETLEKFSKDFAIKVPFSVSFYYCAFNQEDRQAIVDGVKNRFSTDMVMTGREFCELIGLDYDGIVGQRKADAEDNVEFYAQEVTRIPSIKTRIDNDIRNALDEADFYDALS